MAVWALILGLSAQAQTRDDVYKQDIESAIKKLGSDKFTESYLAREELVEIGRRAVPALVAELNRKDLADPKVKRALCEILGRIRDPHKDALAALVARLKDSDEYGTTIASAAAHSLASIADDSAVPALIETFKSRQVETDRLLKYECVRALGLLRAKEATDLLRKALEDKKAAKVGDDDEDAHVIASAAADALGLIRAADAVDDLGKLLADGSTDPSSGQTLGIHAARALQRTLEAEIKAEKDSPRGAALTGDAEESKKGLEAWKKWWDDRSAAKNITDTRATIQKVHAAVEAFKKGQGRTPEILGYLKKAPTDAKNFPKDGYYSGEFNDAWGRPLHYNHKGTGYDFDVVSYGSDNAPWGAGHAADLWNHDKWKEAKKAATRSSMTQILDAIRKFQADQKRWPDTLHNLVSKPGFVTGNYPEKGYLQTLPRDGYDAFFVYRMPGTEGEPFDLLSTGADKAEGGADENEDVWNHDKRPKKDEKKDGKK